VTPDSSTSVLAATALAEEPSTAHGDTSISLGLQARPRVGFVSLGCPKNLVDSEVMMGLLDHAGAQRKFWW
jgi:hypothetical protein